MEVSNVNFDQQFEFTSKAKMKSFLVIGIGILLTVIGIIGASNNWSNFDPSLGGHGHGGHTAHEAEASHEHGAEAAEGEAKENDHAHAEHGHAYSWTTRLKANIWHNNMFFMGISVIGVFFLAINYITFAGWSAGIIRVFLSLGWFLPIGGILIVITWFLFNHDLFHWTDHTLYDPESANYDAIIAGKEWYLTKGFYIARMIAYPVLWTLFFFLMYKRQKMIDDSAEIKHHDVHINLSGAFIVIFAVTSSMAAWDWIMSIDVHWFSTMFGWYVFSSWFVTGIAVITYIVCQLKKHGYLAHVNEEVLHDLGKFMFAFSIFWTYIWFSQFILYWYSNIPEETVWFVERMFLNMGNYKSIFILNLLINFLFPFLFLMSDDSKRQTTLLKVAAVGIFIGHWFDFYLMIMPGTIGPHGGLSLGMLFLELGIALIYTGIFAFTVLFGLTKLKLVAKNHPYLEESLHYTS